MSHPYDDPFGYDDWPYEPEYTRGDAEYDTWMDEQERERDIEAGLDDETLAQREPFSTEESRDESDLSDAALEALDALNRRDEIDPPQPPAELIAAWSHFAALDGLDMEL